MRNNWRSTQSIKQEISWYGPMTTRYLHDGWFGYMMTFMFNPLPGSERTKDREMRTEMEGVYASFITRLIRRPRSSGVVLPRLITCPDWPVNKAVRRTLSEIKTNGGLHHHGILLVPPANKHHRLKVPVEQHFREHQDYYVRDHLLKTVDARPFPVEDAERVTDYVLKGLKANRLDDDETLLFPSLEAMTRMEGSTVFTYTPNDRWIVIEGPSPDDENFTISWLEAAREADRLWLRHATDASEANDPWERLCSHNPIYRGASDQPEAGFSTTAMAFVRKWLKNRASFVLNVSRSRWPEMFCLMVFAGFFVATGDRYQMAIPQSIDVRKMHNSLSDWLNRSDEGNRHSENLLLTLTEHEAKSWKARLRHMNSYQRLADRAILLASPT
jgi:hypothetical protein